MPMDTIRYILFDLDGTLVDSPIDFIGMRESLKISKKVDILGHVEELKGHDQNAYENAKKIIYDYEYQASLKTEVFPGVEDFLGFLKKKQIPMGVVTRNCREVADEQLKSLNHFFVDILTRDEVSKPKPDPESFHHYRDQHQFKKEETLFIGNHFHDYEFAENSGLKYLEFVPPHVQTSDQTRVFEFDNYNTLMHEFYSQSPMVFTE